MKHSLTYFGEINFTLEKDYYLAKTEFNSVELSLDINIDKFPIKKRQLNRIEKMLLNIKDNDFKNRKSISSNLAKGGEATDYVNFHFEELLQEQLEKIVDSNKDLSFQRIDFISKVDLIRIGFYPNEIGRNGDFVIFDYSIKIGADYSNQLLVLKRNKRGRLLEVTWES